ncbi:CinA family protein [Gymnodinialimonas hymeniacidonis]|uniref:CinA family protein n=1 Tax=Gymnodinialimonas hymeniacidonis TaxID=3126508 RepID=UPI0034C5F467
MNPQAVNEALHKAGMMLATAESCTGGLIAGAITDVPGSSDVLDRGFVTYSNAAKSEMLGVDPALIEAHGAVSEPVARAMAAGALKHSGADIAVSVTGVAGPGGTDAKPEGMVCFGLAMDGHETKVETVQFGPLGRPVVRMRTIEHALSMILDALKSKA